MYEREKQETLLLRQRFHESKAKKAKKGDHKNAAKEAAAANNGANADNQRSLLAQKLNKRSAPGGSPLNLNSDNLPDENERANKIPRTSGNTPDSGAPGGGNAAGNTGSRDQKFQQQQSNSNQSQQQQQQQQQISGFSVQIVQQFTSSASPKSQHSQTIQTNVTVQALPNSVKTSNSPLNNLGGKDDIGTSISVGTNFECKRERETDLGTCGGAGTGGPNNPGGNNGNNPSANQTTSNSGPETLSAADSDRFAETLANLGFPDDSNDELQTEILNDLFNDDIFTNSADLMKDFNFDDAVCTIKDGDDGRDLGSVMIDMERPIGSSSMNQQQQQQMHNFQFSQSQQQMFDQNQGRPGFGGGGGPSGPRMNFNPVSPNVMDFKLEPSPAAQTLKQMAEQHQSMQQKQMGLGLGSPHHHHPQSPFSNEPFDHLSSLRTNYLNGSPVSSGLSPLSKGPPSGLQFGGAPFGQQPTGAGHQSPGSQQTTQSQPPQPTGAFSAGLRPGGVVFKQEANTGMYPGLNNGGAGGGPGSCKNPMVSGPTPAEIQEMRNRQAQQMQRITPDQKPPHLDTQYTGQSNTSGPIGSPIDQKPNLKGKQIPNQSGHPGSAATGNTPGPGPPSGQQQQQSPYAATRPLSHFTDPVSSQNQGGPSVQSMPNRQSPVSVGNMGGGQFMRGGATAGMTPSPPISQGGQQGHFAASPGQNRPSSGPTIHMTQTQQLQINQGSQQMQIFKNARVEVLAKANRIENWGKAFPIGGTRSWFQARNQAETKAEADISRVLSWLMDPENVGSNGDLAEDFKTRSREDVSRISNILSGSVSQSQQLQINQQDVKPQIHQQGGPNPTNQPQGPQGPNQPSRDNNLYSYQAAQQQHQSQTVSNNQYQLSMAQSQSVSFGAQYGSQGPPQTMGPTLDTPVVSNRGRRQAQFMGGRPPPEYKPQPNFAPNKAGGIRYPPNTRMVPPYSEAINPRGMAPQTRPQGLNPSDMNHYQGGGPVGANPNNPNVQTSQSQPKGTPASANKPVYTSALSRNRAPNVNVGPEGLNISQRPPAEWRQMFQQQAQLQQQQHQQQHQIQMQQQQLSIRMQNAQAQRFNAAYRSPQPNAFNNVPQQGPGGVPMNSNPMMVRGGHHPNMAQMQHVQQQLHQQSQQHSIHANQVRGMGMTRPPRQRGVMAQQQHAIIRQSLESVNHQQHQNQLMNMQMTASQQMYTSSTQRAAPQTQNNSGGNKPPDHNNANSESGVDFGSDTHQFNLDFLDSIEPTTTDLLSFDSMGTPHFSLLDDM